MKEQRVMDLQSLFGAVVLLAFYGLAVHSVCRWAAGRPPASGAWEKGLPISLIFSLAVVLAVVLFRAAETANVLGFVNAVAGRAGWSQTLSVVGPSFLAAGLGSLSLQLLAVQRTPAAAVVGLILLWWGHPPRVSCAIASRLLPPILLRVSSCCWLLRL